MAYEPYCGLPPLPANLAASWNLDPVLLACLAVGGVSCTAFVLMMPRTARYSRVAAVAGVELLLCIVFVSPLCSLAMALFSARLVQHIVLTVVAAPFLSWALLAPSASKRVRVSPWLAACGFFLVFWFWHMPAGYALTLASDSAYWAMHLSTFSLAIVLWYSIFQGAQNGDLSTPLAAFATAAQMSLLSALMLFSHTHWHAWHTGTTQPFGLSPMEDQVIGAAIMWTAGGVVFFAICIALSGRLVGRSQTGGDAEGRAAHRFDQFA